MGTTDMKPTTRSWLIDGLYNLPRPVKQYILISFDLCIIPIAVWLAIVLRWGGLNFDFGASEIFATLATMAISAIVFVRTGLYRAMVRYMGQQALTTVIRDVSWSTVVLALALFLFRSDAPRSTPLIYWGICLFFIGGGRLLVRSSYQNLHRWHGKKVAIYGAGDSGRQLLQSLFQSGEFAPMLFLDDNAGIQGSVINGIPVYSPRMLPELIKDIEITHVLLALPNAERAHKRKIIEYLTTLPVQVKTVPSFSALVSGLARVGDVVDVEVEDLLGRETVPPDEALLKRCITGKVVMVTGSGGSIGSELCRQILVCRPRQLILLDNTEYNLYRIHRELDEICRAAKIDASLLPLLGNVQNEAKLRAIIEQQAVQTVYHAAAYKHVPLVEQNVCEGIANNVFGTLAACRAAAEGNVETFVLISTDKAVRPPNIMGASKRIAELIVQAYAHKHEKANYCVVRFGNVLGSSGSVVPLFREQISRGGPVTVTHPEVQRYFMTIPEAAQLVLQAGALGEKGDVFVLDMGQPVYIADLARRMIKLMGHAERSADNPAGDIDIQFIGLRPGEKLVEELLLNTSVTGTSHAKILRAREEWVSEEQLCSHLHGLKIAVEGEDLAAIHAILEMLVHGFSNPVLELHRKPSVAASRNVVPLFSGETSSGGPTLQ